MKIVAVGDIMPGGVLNKTARDYVSQEIKQALSWGDVRVGTLETAIGNKPSFYEEKMKRKADVIYVQDEDLARLKDLNINIVSLANNHFTDLGPLGAQHAIDLLNQMGILHCGAGKNIEEARRPVIVTKGGETYAFIAFCDWREETVGWCPIATETSFGVNPMFEDAVVSQIRLAKEMYNYVVVIPHWGIEYRVAPTAHVFDMAKKMLEAGADLVLGGHTHCIQPIWHTHKKCVVFSMGNFLFPDRLLNYPRSTYYHAEPIDLSVLPMTDGYPRFVKEITYKVWKPIARYGVIIQTELIKSCVKSKGIYTYLSTDNFLSIADGKFPNKNKIWILQICMECHIYSLVLDLITIKNLILNFVRT